MRNGNYEQINTGNDVKNEAASVMSEMNREKPTRWWLLRDTLGGFQHVFH